MKLNRFLFIFSLFLFFSFQGHSQITEKLEQTYLSDINSAEYGQNTTIGIGTIQNFVNLIIRHRLNSEHQVGLAVSLLPTIELAPNGNWDKFSPGVLLQPEFNFHVGNTYKEKFKGNYIKKKFRKHFISIKPGLGLSVQRVQSLALTWHRQAYLLENKKQSCNTDLGLFYAEYSGDRQ